MLKIQNMNSYYGKSHIIHDLNINVEDGEIVALLGRNGAGKTTTIESIMGFVPRVEGSIEFKGVETVGKNPESVYEQGISWVPEGRRVFPNLTVEQNLGLGLRNPDKKSNVQEVMDLFPRLEERRSQMARSMSGGEQQMLALGRAFVSDPDLLLVDEPFEGLMPSLIPQISEALTQYRQRGMSMLVTEQKTQQTLDLADRAYIIQTGSIVYSGSSKELIDDPKMQKEYIGVM